MARYLDPKSDLVFKKIFGKHPELLKSFLNAVLPLPSDGLIEDLEYLSTENVPEIPGFKYSVVDVRCVDSKGRHFIVEMQIQWSNHFMQRMLFNTAAVYVRQLKRAISYDNLSPVYGLAIVDAECTDEEDWFHHYQLTHAKNANKTLDGIQLIFIELPKFKPVTIVEKKLAVLWLRFLTEIDDKTAVVDPELLNEPKINEALMLTEVAAYSSDELMAYEKSWDAVRAEKTLLVDNYTKGLEEGIEKGLEKGRQEREYEIARNLLLDGLKPESVAKNTGIGLETILKIQASLN